MLIIEKGRRRTAPAETARVKVLKNSLKFKEMYHCYHQQALNRRKKVIKLPGNQHLKAIHSSIVNGQEELWISKTFDFQKANLK